MSDTRQPQKMTADQIKAARAQLGMSTSELADALRMGANGSRKVQRWEDGSDEISGPASVAIEALLSGWRPV